MSEHKTHAHGQSHTREYWIVFAILAILTFIELFIPEMDIAYSAKAIWLTLLAVVKALLVAFSFMHLRFETKWLWFIAAIPISAALYTAMVITESMYR
jgi:cytochrome c oxidase subunit 4